MCITSSRSLLDNTYIGVWDIEHPKYGYRHVLAYQNRVKNISDGPNCMLLQIQSNKAIDTGWLIDTTKHQNFLTELYDIINPLPIDDGMALMSMSEERVNYIVERGIYHIAILNNLSDENVKTT